MSDCIFCKIASGDIPSTKVYEDDSFVAFLDLGPASIGHTLLIPKKHYENIFDIPEDVLGNAFKLAKQIALTLKDKLGASGVNIVQNNGVDAGQTVFHFHIHIIPRYPNDNAGFGWNEGELTDEIKNDILAKIN